ncbi:MAG: FAD-binding protein [Caldilineae bacterium]|nr:MAG: FAD-binding protein [Caldilineae bacterium]
MARPIGTATRPLRVAIIGAGPSGFYAAQALLSQKDYDVRIDLFDHLPTPFGLVRYGVAPDHQKIKSVTKLYERIAADERLRFFGNVTFGKDITHDELKSFYDQIVYAVGAQSDRRLNIPGEDLKGSFPATQFVAWYNGHPDYRDLEFDLDVESAAVIGVGNVAMDVARILALSPDELARTDIADYALEALRKSRIKDIYVIARRGPAQVKFTNPELRELAELEVTDVIIDPKELELDPLSAAAIADNREAQTNLEIMRHYAGIGDTGRPKRIHFLFLRSPVEIYGDDEGRVVRVRLERNELRATETGYLASHGIGEYEYLDVGMVARSIGYRGEPLPGVPFHERWGIISNIDGRVSVYETNEIVPGEYVVGWAKRGPTGVIGTNKPDAVATVRLMLEDVPSLEPVPDERAEPGAIEAFLNERGVRYVTWEEWQLIDAAEVEAGKRVGRPRVKITSVPEMLAAIDEARRAMTQDLLIVGGGPAGLYAAFYAGLRGLKARVLEALPEVGGQLSTLYPEMDIYDMPGFSRINARELVRGLRRQAIRFKPNVDVRTGCRVVAVEREEDVFVVEDSQGNKHRTRRLIIATGLGAILPRKLSNPEVERFEGRGVYYYAHDRSEFLGKRVLVVGGGDSAVLWALSLHHYADEVTLIHRSDRFRATEAHMAELRSSGIPVYEFHEVKRLEGAQMVERAVITDNRTGEEKVLDVDAVLFCLGFSVDQSLLEGLGLELDNGGVRVDGYMQTSVEGVYAIGDVARPAGSVNLRLIATGMAQAAIAVNHACHDLYPEKNLMPPRSSNLRL